MARTLSHGSRTPSARLRYVMPLLLASAIVLGCGREEPATAPEPTTSVEAFAWPSGPHPTVILEVAGRGSITIELYPELAPKTVDHFRKLAEQDFYDGTTFHRVIPGFMIQGGDPNSRDRDPANDGFGGPGYTIPDERSAAPHVRGAVSMANSGRADSGGSQFFIVHQDSPQIDGGYSLFGRVIDGMEIVDAISGVETDAHGRWGPRDRPLENVVIADVVVREAGKPTGTPAASASAPTR